MVLLGKETKIFEGEKRREHLKTGVFVVGKVFA